MLYYGPQTVIPSPLGSPANTGSMAANITSQPVVLQSLYACSFGASWTGSTPVGAIAIQGSNDYSQNVDGSVNNPGTWSTMTVSYLGAPVQSIAVTGNTGSALVDITATGVYAIRLVYTATSGTGSITVTMFGKAMA